jgi:D-beta-D-heptose 7-phosphate kinase/D-beta-D-heptose 1-phosphate adenosyltransferase
MNDIFASFSARRLIVVGDIIVDEYFTGEQLGLSAETPTIVVKHLSARQSLGGAALMVRNVLALGGSVVFVSLVGDDAYQGAVAGFEHPRLKKIITVERGRSTIVKSRYWVHGYKLLQWDHLDHQPPQPGTVHHLLGEVERHLPEADGLIISDYRHGLVTPEFARSLVAAGKAAGKPVSIDSQVSQRAANHDWYSGASLFCMNEREAMGVDPQYDPSHLPAALSRLKQRLHAESIVLKRGAKGCCALIEDEFAEAAAANVQPVDTTGAGDAFFAALSLGPAHLTAQHLELANAWAGLSTTTLGPEPPELAGLARLLGLGLGKDQ